MSSTGRKKTDPTTGREEKAKRSDGSHADFCPTPDLLARAIVTVCPIRPTDVVVEPSAGGGAFLRALADVHGYRHAIAVEPHADQYHTLRSSPHGELVERRWEDYRRPNSADWVIGNPPFKAAQDHVAYAMMTLKPGGHLVFLLRIGFLQTSDRNAQMEAMRPWRRWDIVGRPSFYGGGSDGSEYAAFVWRKGFDGRDADLITRDLRWKDDEHQRLNAGTWSKIRRKDWPDFDGWPALPTA